MNTALHLVGLWIQESRPAPITYYPHDCIMELTGVCMGCEELLEWNACVKEEWIEEFHPFFGSCSSAQKRRCNRCFLLAPWTDVVAGVVARTEQN